MKAHELVALMAPAPGRAAFALRLAVIASIVTVIVELYGLSAATTVYIVFFTNKPDRAGSIKLCLVMLIAATLTLAIALQVAKIAIDWPFRRVIAMSAFSIALLFVGSASKLKPLAPTLAMIVGFYLDLIGSVEAGELATRGLLYAWLLPAIPVGVGIVVNLLVAPRPRALLQRELAVRIKTAAGAARAGGREAADACLALLRSGDADLQEHLNGARFEGSATGRTAAAMSVAMSSTVAILSATEFAARRDDPAARPWFRSVATTLDEMAAALASGGYPVGITLQLPPDGMNSESKRACLLLHSSIVGFAEEPAPDVREDGGFFAADAMTNPEHLAFALKTTGAAMTCYLIYQLLDWPGIHTCLITCYIVALTTVGETVEKLTLRIAGAMVGALLGLAAIVWLLPHMTDVVSLVAVIFVVTFACAWIAAGGPRIGYAGFQIVFAFYLSVLQKSYPTYDLSIGRDRVIGILLGNAVMFLVFTRIRPVSLARDVDGYLAGAATSLAAIAREAGERAGAAAARARNLVANARRALPATRYEPVSIRPGSAWTTARQAALDELDGIQSAILVESGGDFGRAAAAQLDLLAADFRSAHAGTRNGQGDVPSMRDRLDAIEAALRHTAPGPVYAAR